MTTIQATPSRHSDRDALVTVVDGDGGRVCVRVEQSGARGGRRSEHVTLSDAGRRQLIKALGGVPVDDRAGLDAALSELAAAASSTG